MTRERAKELWPIIKAFAEGKDIEVKYQPNEGIEDPADLRKQRDELVEALKKAQTLVSLLTVGQVIDAGDEAINAAGFNPWCLNEGAEKNEQISTHFIDATLARCKPSGTEEK